MPKQLNHQRTRPVKRISGLCLAIIALALAVSVAGEGAGTHGFLYLESGEDTADFVIDGNINQIYQTPRLCTLLVGQHTVKIYKMHRGTITFMVSILPDEVLRKQVNLIGAKPPQPAGVGEIDFKPRYGQLTILTDPPDALVFLDGIRMHRRTPVTLKKVETGRRAVRVAAQSFTWEDTVLILVDSTKVLNLTYGDISQANRAQRDAIRVAIRATIELPGCRYRRDNNSDGKNNNVMIRGIDPLIDILTTDTTIHLSHHQLANFEVIRDGSGRVVAKEMPDTSIVVTLEQYIDSTIIFDLNLFSNPDRGFTNRANIDGTARQYQVPANLNRGEPVEVLLRIDAGGQVTFRYY